MNSQAFYRKWRPQTLADLVGQEHVTKTLSHAVKEQRITHAYLFCGPRGTGKTSSGRILAKAVNCLDNDNGEPCNHCEMCRSISQGRALDVIEIDAASNRGIDEIRELKERVNFVPSVGKYKVYIIDEVHMLTEQASNALLKTLEEPPSYVIFILATTEPHKLLSTILSRCQRFDFRRLTQDAIVSKLQHICEHENITAELSALRLISRGASGSLRDAENLLQQHVAQYGSDIQVHQVEDSLGITTDSRVKELAKHIIAKNIAAGLATINSVACDGLDLKQFNQALVEYLRGVLLTKSGAQQGLDFAPEDMVEIEDLAKQADVGQILKAIKLFGQVDFRFNEYTPLPLELAMVECTLAGDEDKPAVMLQERKENTSVSAEPIKPAKRAEPVKYDRPTDEVEQSKGEVAVQKPQVEGTASIEHIRYHWRKFVDTLKGGSGGSLDAFLRGACEPVAVENDTLVLSFNYPFHMEKIENPKSRQIVEEKLSEMFGKPNKVRCALKPKTKQKPTEGHLVKAALDEGAVIMNVEEKNG